MRPPWGLELTGAEWAELWRLLCRREMKRIGMPGGQRPGKLGVAA